MKVKKRVFNWISPVVLMDLGEVNEFNFVSKLLISIIMCLKFPQPTNAKWTFVFTHAHLCGLV